MVEEVAATVSFTEVLDLLDVIRNGLQQVMKLHLQVQHIDKRKFRVEAGGLGRGSRGEGCRKKEEEMLVQEEECK